MDKIVDLRQHIDALDNELMALLSKRFDISIEIGKLKSKSKKEILDESRENDIMDKITKHSHPNQLMSVYKTIMGESKKIQKR